MKFAIWGEADKTKTQEFTQQLTRAKNAGIKKILACIYNTAEAKFNSKVCYDSHDLLETYLLPETQKHGLELHAWVMMMRYTARDKFQKDKWFSVNRLGESALDKPQYVDYYRWLSPFVPEVQQYLYNLIEEISQLEVSGVHLDYIRYCDRLLPPGLLHLYDLTESDQFEARFDYGYHLLAIQKFIEQEGYNPLEVDINDGKWKQFRLDEISKIVKNCGEIVKKQSKVFSAAIFPNPNTAPKNVLQDWGSWPLDEAYPMIYHKFYKQDYHWVAEEYQICKQLSSAKTMIPGISLGDFTPEELRNCLHELKDMAVLEVSLFDIGALSQELANVIQDFAE